MILKHIHYSRDAGSLTSAVKHYNYMIQRYIDNTFLKSFEDSPLSSPKSRYYGHSFTLFFFRTFLQ